MGPNVGFLDGGGVSAGGPRSLVLRSPGKATSGAFSRGGGGGVEAWIGLGLLGPGVGGSFGFLGLENPGPANAASKSDICGGLVKGPEGMLGRLGGGGGGPKGIPSGGTAKNPGLGGSLNSG